MWKFFHSNFKFFLVTRNISTVGHWQFWHWQMKCCMVFKWRKQDLHHIAFQGPYVIGHKRYGINDEVYMEACLQNLIFENCTPKKTSIWIRKRGTIKSAYQIKTRHWLEEIINEQIYKIWQHTCSPQFTPQLFS